MVIERLYFILRERWRREPAVVAAIFADAEAGHLDAAAKCGAGSRDFVARVLTFALEHRDVSFSNALLQASNRELQRYNWGLPMLDTIITLAPLEGLFGTVTGMIHAFGLLGASELGAPTAITGGIAEALIATAFGLLIAMVALLPFNYRNARLEQARQEIENAASHLELLLLKSGGSQRRIEDERMTVIPSPRSNRRARIEIIPLIDIIFFLLATFVMVSLSMVQNRGIPVDLPAAETGAPQSREDAVFISITEQGEIFFDRERVDAAQLEAALGDLVATNPAARIFLSGDTRTEFGTAIEVLDEVRRAGIASVAIETRPKTP